MKITEEEREKITKLVEQVFSGLAYFINDEEILIWYKKLIATCIEDYSQEVNDECFKLAAYQCHNPISSEYGTMYCKDVQYWKERCRLAEALLEREKIPLMQGNHELYAKVNSDYNKFLTDNGNKPY